MRGQAGGGRPRGAGLGVRWPSHPSFPPCPPGSGERNGRRRNRQALEEVFEC